MVRLTLPLFIIFLNLQALAQQFSAEELAHRNEERRAREAVIWGMPAVNFELMCEAMFRSRGQFNQIIYWSRLPDWKNQTLTPNADVIYMMPFFNTKDVGPMVLEIPPADKGSITGSVDDGWQTAIEDVGPAGKDKGKGAKYLILPPRYDKKVPKGYIALSSQTYAGFALLRSNPKSGNPDDIAKAVTYGKRVKFYPLSKAANPPATVYVDVVDMLFDGTITYDTRFFTMLDRFVQREPWLTRDKAYIGMLKTIGIGKGVAFNPDEKMVKLLDSAALEAHQLLNASFRKNFDTPFNSGGHWAFPATSAFVDAIQKSFSEPDSYPVDDRGSIYSMGYFSAKRLGEGQFYLMAIADKKGQPLNSKKTYTLYVPPNPPVKLYWSVTLYDRATHAIIRDQKWASRASTTPGLVENKNGSYNIFFGPSAPKGYETNWINTGASETYEAMFRFYGPEKALFEKRWQLPDIEAVTYKE